MQIKRLLLGMGVGLAVTLVPAALVRAQSQPPAALTGHVTSEAEGAMEGVVVSAKKAGSTVTVSVVSDAQGRYSFPANRLSAGKYSLRSAPSATISSSRPRRTSPTSRPPRSTSNCARRGTWPRR